VAQACYTNLIDGSARGLQPTSNSFYQMKSRETFCPIGPFIVTADEVPDPQNLAIKLWNNGTLMQDFNTNDMAHKIPRCIEFVSSVHTIEPGDVLATGTNHRGLNPFMDGDRVELEVEGLGRLHINVQGDLKRTWERQTRAARQRAHPGGYDTTAHGKIRRQLAHDDTHSSFTGPSPQEPAAAVSDQGGPSAPLLTGSNRAPRRRAVATLSPSASTPRPGWLRDHGSSSRTRCRG
jgi:hypothetical protein